MLSEREAISVRFYFLFLTSVSFFLLASPAWAGKLLSWRFVNNENKLFFNTESPVQPKALLINNPSRIIIDLPNTQLGRSPINQPISREIRSIRIGQFDENTTRLVIEFAPGYTVDPTKVKVKGETSTSWTVTLPNTQPGGDSNNSEPPSSARPQQNTPRSSFSNSDLQLTSSGLFVNLRRNGAREGVIIQRSIDRSTVDIQLKGALLTNGLINQTIAVNHAGVARAEFRQMSDGARITLSIEAEGPDWMAAYSALGGVLLFPRGGFNGSSYNNSYNSESYRQPTQIAPSNYYRPPIYRTVVATIYGAELTSNNNLLIRSNRPIRGDMVWNRSLGAYEIRIPRAQLADSPTGPSLGDDSPIYELRLRQEADQSVTILIKPSTGSRVDRLVQVSPQLLSLQLKTSRPNISLAGNNQLQPISPLGRINHNKPLIIIDPGHGGKDTGALGLGGIQEKDIILSISQRVGQLLENKGMQVMFTRNSDFFVSLQGRTDMANAAGADLFVSIHANSIEPNRADVNGVEVYYFGDSTLASTIYQSITQNMNVRGRGIRRARFYVLRNSKMPSTLVEVGYVTGNEDSVNLTNPNFQAQMANSIVKGVLEYIEKTKH